MQAGISHWTVGVQTKRILGRNIFVQFCRSFHKAYIYIRRLLLFRWHRTIPHLTWRSWTKFTNNFRKSQHSSRLIPCISRQNRKQEHDKWRATHSAPAICLCNKLTFNYFTSSKTTLTDYQCVSTGCCTHVAKTEITIDNQHVTKSLQRYNFFPKQPKENTEKITNLPHFLVFGWV